MRIRLGHAFTVVCDQPTPLVTLTSVRPERQGDLEAPERQFATADLPVETFTDAFGNHCRRFTVPAGEFTFGADAVIRDTGLLDARPDPEARIDPVDTLPAAALTYLLGSRYIESDLLAPMAWDLFGHTDPGWARVQAISDFAHSRIKFNYQDADSTRTAMGAYQQQKGVCRDFTHLAIGLARAMNIPARYVNGYLGDIGVPAVPLPMDFSAWMEVWMAGRWWTVDARHNAARIGRVVVAYGRDAADVPMLTSFGPHWLKTFRVWTDEIAPGEVAGPLPFEV